MTEMTMAQALKTLAPTPETEAQIPDAPVREIVSLNPATLEELGRVPIASSKDVKTALAKAKAAQPAWAALSYNERARHILRAKAVLLERQDELCDLMARETGKPRVETISSEVLPVANLMDYFARKSARLLRDEQFTL